MYVASKATVDKNNIMVDKYWHCKHLPASENIPNTLYANFDYYRLFTTLFYDS